MTRSWPWVVMPLLGAVALTLTMPTSGAGAATAGAPMRAAPGLLPDRSCQDPTGAEVTLKVLASAAAAHAFFRSISTASVPGGGVNDQFTKLKGYGNEAVYGMTCSADETVCGPDVEVRVVNDVFTIAEVRVSAPLVKLAGKVVSELCPNCKFTTSPHAA
jgi:hypothetical protein